MPDPHFQVGDRVIVRGGYEAHPDWLQGGTGYAGRLIAIDGTKALVELDDEVSLKRETGWQDFGSGSSSPLRTLTTAQGRWLVLLQGWVGGVWTNPTGRLHVGLCRELPDLRDIPGGGGAGAWVESHAGMVWEGGAPDRQSA